MNHDLTPQEWKMLVLLANGYTGPRIASELGIHLQTVKNHLQSAYRKLGARNRFEAFLELGWLTPPEMP